MTSCLGILVNATGEHSVSSVNSFMVIERRSFMFGRVVELLNIFFCLESIYELALIFRIRLIELLFLLFESRIFIDSGSNGLISEKSVCGL